MPNPAEWRDLLVHRLDARWGQIRRYDDYYEGNQVLAYVTERARRQYGGLFGSLADNWMRLVVDASAERLHIQGFRFGKQDADDDAWTIWQANGLDAESNMLHTEAIKLSEAYWLVQPNGDDIPRITAEHPQQVIVACAPGDRRTRLAALKKWGDGNDVFANVYLPDRVVKYRQARRPTVIDGIQDFRTAKWETIGGGGNPLGVVPVVPAPNNPSMLRGGSSDLAGGVTSLQDAVNKELADMLFGSEYTAKRQRVILGIDQPRDSRGTPIPIDQKAVQEEAERASVWLFPGKDGKAFEFAATDLDNFRKAIDGIVKDLTAQTRTPPHYVAGQIVNASGDALKAAETGLVAKVRDKMVPFGEAHEEAMRLAFRAWKGADDPRATATDAETIWKDPESRSQAELVDAVTKQVAIGLPFEVALEKMGYSPQEIDRILAIKETEALTAEAFAPPAPPQPEMNGAGVPPVAPTR